MKIEELKKEISKHYINVSMHEKMCVVKEDEWVKSFVFEESNKNLILYIGRKIAVNKKDYVGVNNANINSTHGTNMILEINELSSMFVYKAEMSMLSFDHNSFADIMSIFMNEAMAGFMMLNKK